MDRFLYDKDLSHERVKNKTSLKPIVSNLQKGIFQNAYLRLHISNFK